jgi:hypothetical protein
VKTEFRDLNFRFEAELHALTPKPVTRAEVRLLSWEDEDLAYVVSHTWGDSDRYVGCPRKVEQGTAALRLRLLREGNARGGVCADDREMPDALKQLVETTLRSIAASVVGWPGAAVVSHPPAKGEEVKPFEQPLATMFGIRLEDQAASGPVSARFRGSSNDALVFDVSAIAVWASAYACRLPFTSAPADSNVPDATRWVSEARAVGELMISAADGAFMTLHLHGPTMVTERPCSEPGAAPEGSPSTQGRRGAGEITFGAGWVCEVPEF